MESGVNETHAQGNGAAPSVRKRLHIHTDCVMFGGCEVMPSVIFEDEGIAGSFDVSMSYRWSPTYQEGLAQYVRKAVRLFPLRLPDLAGDLWGKPGALRGLYYLTWLCSRLYLFFLYDVVRLTIFFLRLRPDIAHVNSGGYPGADSTRAAILAAKLAGVRSIHFHVNSYAADRPTDARRWIEQMIDRWISACMSSFGCGSDENIQRLIDARGFPKDKGRLLRNTPHPKKRTAVTMPPDTIRARVLAGRPSDTCVFLAAGHLQAHKGHGVLIEAVRILRGKTARPFQVWIEGFGPCETEYRATVERQALTGHVVLLGRVPNLQEYINACDVFVHPSYGYDDLPLVVLEALQLGKPCIGSRHFGLPSQITEATGLLVEKKNPSALAEAMERMMNDAAWRERLRQGAKQHFERRFSYEVVMAEYREFYAHLSNP